MLSSYQHLFFDLDHTLWDFEGNTIDCLAEMYEHFSLKSMGVEDFDAFYVNFSTIICFETNKRAPIQQFDDWRQL